MGIILSTARNDNLTNVNMSTPESLGILPGDIVCSMMMTTKWWWLPQCGDDDCPVAMIATRWWWPLRSDVDHCALLMYVANLWWLTQWWRLLHGNDICRTMLMTAVWGLPPHSNGYYTVMTAKCCLILGVSWWAQGLLFIQCPWHIVVHGAGLPDIRQNISLYIW